MTVIVQLAPDLASQLHADTKSPDASADWLRQLADELGSLRPMHPGASDPVLQTYFTVEVPDAAKAQQVISKLLKSRGVQAAYVKPPEALA